MLVYIEEMLIKLRFNISFANTENCIYLTNSSHTHIFCSHNIQYEYEMFTQYFSSAPFDLPITNYGANSTGDIKKALAWLTKLSVNFPSVQHSLARKRVNLENMCMEMQPHRRGCKMKYARIHHETIHVRWLQPESSVLFFSMVCNVCKIVLKIQLFKFTVVPYT